MCVCVCVCVGKMVTRLQVVCVTSLTSDGSLETKAAEDSLAVRKAASADVDAVCARLVTSRMTTHFVKTPLLLLLCWLLTSLLFKVNHSVTPG